MNLTSLSILPFFFQTLYMASTPDIVAAAFSKALCIQGIFHAVNSEMQVETSRHPVAFEAITGYSDAMSTIFTTVGAPQPEHILCPCVRRSSFFESSFSLSGVAMSLPYSDIILNGLYLAAFRYLVYLPYGLLCLIGHEVPAAETVYLVYG